MRRGRRPVIGGLVVLAATLALAACTTGNTSTQAAGTGGVGSTSAAASATGSATPSVTPTTAAPTPAVVTVAPAASKPISPATPITVSVADGKLSSVELTNPAEGKVITGQAGSDGSSWTSTEDLGYGKTYKLSAVATNDEGVRTTKTASYTTLTPPNMTMPYFQYTGGYALTNGMTYGVGIVPIVHWDEPITDEKAALSTITVTTTPHVAGAWYWSDDQDVAFRPEKYWPSGTKVTITVKDYGHQVSPGLYGQADISIGFKIGASHITKAYDNAPNVDKVKVYWNGTLVKTMNTSMGKHSGEQVGDKYIDFHTMQGTYTVIHFENPADMCSDSYGLPANAPGGYGCEDIYWSTKISTDGIYLHELDTTVWDQNNGVDVSHGCLNLDEANAQWFFQHSQIGDVVEISGTDGPTIQYWQGGAWSVPWTTWVAGGELVP